MIPRKILIAAALVATTALSQAAYAKDDGLFFRPYVGADFQHWSVDYETDDDLGLDYGEIFNDSYNGASLYVGARVHRYFGLELGYSRTAEEGKNATFGPIDTASKARLSSVSLEALGFLPVWESGSGDKFELIGTLGAARLSYKASLASTALGVDESGTDNEIKLRGGVGFQYTLNDALGFRTLVRYQDADFDSSVKNSLIYSVGLNYTF